MHAALHQIYIFIQQLQGHLKDTLMREMVRFQCFCEPLLVLTVWQEVLFSKPECAIRQMGPDKLSLGPVTAERRSGSRPLTQRQHFSHRSDNWIIETSEMKHICPRGNKVFELHMSSFVKTWIGLNFLGSLFLFCQCSRGRKKGKKGSYYLNVQTNLEQTVQETPCSLLPARCFQCLAQSETIKRQDELVSWGTGRSSRARWCGLHHYFSLIKFL